MHDLPFWVGALGLAAVFSAEISAADAVLFMLATSLSQDLYKRFVNPAASRSAGAERRAAGRRSPAASLGVVVAIVSQTVIDALSIFYTLLGVSLFVPVVAGLYMRRARARDALAAIAGGVVGGRRPCNLERRRAARGVHAGDVRACGGVLAFAAFATLSPVVGHRRSKRPGGAVRGEWLPRFGAERGWRVPGTCSI